MKRKAATASMWYIMLSLFLLTGCSSKEESRNAQNYLLGNTNGNIQDGGLVLINNGWIYYTNRDENEHLYKKRPDGSEKKVGKRSLQLSFKLY